MDIFYKCACMAKETKVVVPDRRPGTDLLVWMETVTHCIGYDHRAASPRCPRTEMEYAKIPLAEGANEIGVPLRAN